MRTSDEADEITRLPPPPAPTARDANPWQVSGAPAPARRAPSIRAPRGRDAATRPARDALRNLVAIGIVAFLLVSGALEALRGGEPESLIGIAFTVFILVMFFLARQRSARRRAARSSGSGQPSP